MLRNNFRLQLIGPVALALVLMVVGAIVFITVNQSSNSVAVRKQLDSSFSDIKNLVAGDLSNLSKQLEERLVSMETEASRSIEQASSEALKKTGSTVASDLRTIRMRSGYDLADLMALSAVNSVIAKDYATLNSYVRSAHANKDVVFLFYLDNEGLPLTRYLNRKNEKLKSFLPKGKPDIDVIIQAGQTDADTIVITKGVKSEDTVIGSVVLGLDMTSFNQQTKDLSDRFDALIADNSALISNILGQKAQSINSDLQKVVDTIQGSIGTHASKTLETVSATTDHLGSAMRNQFIGGAFVGIVLLLGLLFWNARTILKTLGAEPALMVRLATRIADGGLSGSRDASTQPGSLLAALQDMTEKLRTLIGNIVTASRTLQATSTELALAAEDMTGGAEQSASKAVMVAAATEEMSVNMDTVTNASDQAFRNVNEVAQSIEALTAAVKAISENTTSASTMTTDAVAYAQSASQKVNQLGSAAYEISKVTEVINEISDQTNLLALNATIEAARAGEAGKGFAVVANEIKELAKQTAESTGQIRMKIESIQASTDETVTEITEIGEVINGINNIVSQIAAAVNEQAATADFISTRIVDAADGIREVNDNVAQASQGAGEIARDISEVSQVAAEAKEGSLTLEKSSQNLKQIAESISRDTGYFKLGNVDRGPQFQQMERTNKEIIRWNNSLSVGIASIDSQHQTLVQLINELYRHIGDSEKTTVQNTLQRLIDYTDKHFKFEEKLFREHEYPEQDKHIHAHKKLLEQVMSFQERIRKGESDVSVELLEFLKEWLIKHIKNTDMNYSPFLLGKGVV